MGFGGGGGGALPNHEHSLIPLDGGPIDLAGVTVGSMNAGDITYSSGAAMQQLAYPAVPAGETLTAVAASTAPAWVAGVAPTSAFELLGYTELGANASVITVSFASESGDNMTALQCYYNSSITTNTTDLTCQFSTGGAFKTSQYYTQAFEPSSGAVTWYNNQPEALLQRNPNGRRQSGNFTINCVNSAWGGSQGDVTIVGAGCNTNAGLWSNGSIQDTSTTSLDAVRINTSAGNFYTGSYLAVYKINNS
jgi:hypothetical protein